MGGKRYLLFIAICVLSIQESEEGTFLPAVLIWKANPWKSIPVHQNRSHFAPQPQHCPETGGTVCTAVNDYPADEVYQSVTDTRFTVFNFSSVFFDERDGYDEPKLWFGPQTSTPSPNAIPQAHPPATYSVATLLLLHDHGQHFSFDKNINPWWDVKQYAKTLSRKKRNPVTTEPACATRNLYISPKAALSDKNQWKYIVNIQERDPRIKQIVRAEICRTSDAACSSSISLPFGYTSVCKQKYLKKKLLSLDVDGRGLSEENFFVPSCCVCELVRT